MVSEQLSLIWEGPQSAIHSLAKVNRNICKHLAEFENIQIRLFEDNSYFTEPPAVVTVGHQWPPNLTPPKSHYWICMQPWEFGAIPRQWYIPMRYWVDEIWVYSTYNKASYVRCGIPENKIRVIPLGVAETIYHYDVKPLNIEPSGTFRFLFVGGTIARKGIDILLKAYLCEFSADENVCLIIKDFGTDSFYKGITLEHLVKDAVSDPNHPRIVYLNNQFSEEELAGLYKACDCLVHPYRGEGFGLPIIEAMACGTPAIVPNLGPSQDFCDASTAFFLPSEEEILKQKQIGNLETVDNPWWLKIDQTELQKMMRHVYENREEIIKKGKNASARILSAYTWRQSAAVVSETVKRLVNGKNNSKPSEQEVIDAEMNRGIQLHSQNRLDEAHELFQNILAVYPDSLATRYNVALVSIMRNDYLAAIQHLTYISKVMNNESEAFQGEIWSTMGICYSQIQAYHMAIDSFQKAAKINPLNRSREILCLKKGVQKTMERLFDLYHQLGNCYSEMGNDYHAKEMYLKALEVGFDQPTIKQSLDEVNVRIDRMKKNVMLVHQKQESSPADPVIIWEQSASYPLEDSEEIIQERRKRWQPYFVGGSSVLELEWRDQPDLYEETMEQRYDGLLILLKGNNFSPSGLLNLFKHCFKRIHQTGKFIFLIENQNHLPALLSSKTILETILNSAGWMVKETNEPENGDSYIVAQKAAYDILWQCPLFNSSGYAEEQKHFLDGVRPYPFRVRVQSMDFLSPQELRQSDINIYLSSLQKQKIHTPLIHYQAAPANYFSWPLAPISIGRTMFETDSLPASWVEILNEMSGIWVPSEFNRDTFASAGVKPERIRVIPGTLDETKYDPAAIRPYLLTDKSCFRFLSIFDWSIRKGWDILLRAYFEEFSEHDNVSLILKVTKLNEPNADPQNQMEALAKKLGIHTTPHVHIIQTNLSEEEMIRLYAAVDCFVMPSRGEGWGRPYMEAMAMELPTIGTKWSGQQAFMNEENSFLIQVERLVPVDPNGMPAHFHGHRWAEPSVDHLKALMRYVYNHRSEAEQKGKKARTDLFPRFSRQTIGKQIYDSVDELVKYYFG